jgi:hypothetical protein
MKNNYDTTNFFRHKGIVVNIIIFPDKLEIEFILKSLNYLFKNVSKISGNTISKNTSEQDIIAENIQNAK